MITINLYQLMQIHVLFIPDLILVFHLSCDILHMIIKFGHLNLDDIVILQSINEQFYILSLINITVRELLFTLLSTDILIYYAL